MPVSLSASGSSSGDGDAHEELSIHDACPGALTEIEGEYVGGGVVVEPPLVLALHLGISEDGNIELAFGKTFAAQGVACRTSDLLLDVFRAFRQRDAQLSCAARGNLAATPRWRFRGFFVIGFVGVFVWGAHAGFVISCQ